jgi:hypothetical protein
VKAREFVFDEYKQKSLDTMVEKYFFLQIATKGR